MDNRYTYAVQVRGENGEVVATHVMHPNTKDSYEFSSNEDFCAICYGSTQKMYVVYENTEGVRRETSKRICETCAQIAIETESDDANR